MEIEEKLPDFTGKVIVFYTSSPPRTLEDGIVLEYVKFIKQGGRLFVVGRIPEVEQEGLDWISNLEGGIAWDTVTHYLLFKSRDDYLSRVLSAQPPSLFQRVFGR